MTEQKSKKTKKRDKYLDPARKLKKQLWTKGDSDTNCNWFTSNDCQRLRKRTRGVGNRKTSGGHPLLRSGEILRRVLEA